MKSAAPKLEDSGTKTLRQLQAEEDDEERFQADLKMAVRQSLGKLFDHLLPVMLLFMIIYSDTMHQLDGLQGNEINYVDWMPFCL